jgi:hypothetical protein
VGSEMQEEEWQETGTSVIIYKGELQRMIRKNQREIKINLRRLHLADIIRVHIIIVTTTTSSSSSSSSSS